MCVWGGTLPPIAASSLDARSRLESLEGAEVKNNRETLNKAPVLRRKTKQDSRHDSSSGARREKLELHGALSKYIGVFPRCYRCHSIAIASRMEE